MLASTLFGIDGAATDCSGERDQTFVIDDGSRRAVLKISNGNEAISVLDLEHAILERVASADTAPRVPRPLPLAGRDDVASPDAYLGVVGPDGAKHFVRMFEHLRGRVGVPGADLSDDSVRGFAEATAGLAVAMRGLSHPAAARELLWDVRQCTRLRPLTGAIAGRNRRALVIRLIDRFETEVLPLWPLLRTQVVHGDLTLENTLLDDRDRVSAVIDFGDAVQSSILLDLVSALTAVMRRRDPREVFRIARIFVEGYTSTMPLEPAERQLLGAVLGARLAAVVTINAWHIQRHPDKASYFEPPADDAWALLELFDSAGYEQLDATLRSATA